MKKSIAVLTIALLILIGTIMIAMKISTPPLQKESFDIVDDIIELDPEEESEVTIVEEVEEVEEVIEVEVYTPVQTYVPPASYDSNSRGEDFKFNGVIFENDTRYSWYSQNTLPGGGLDELNSNGRHVDEEGIIRDADGYVAVASCDHEKGTVVSTPFGEGKVYDYCGIPGTIDIYTNF